MINNKIIEDIILLIRKYSKEGYMSPIVLEERLKNIITNLTNDIKQELLNEIKKTK